MVVVARRYAPPNALLSEDSLRNFYVRRPQDMDSAQPVVMLDAHSDEVGFMVQAVRENGLLSILPLGGWVNNTIPAHRVWVKNKLGELIPGVVATKPPHFMTSAERAAPLEIASMYVDVGACSAQEVLHTLNIGIGAPIAPDTQCFHNQSSGLFMGKAFDCRTGCTCVLDIMHQLMEESLSVVPVGAIAAQEEVGTRGAKITAQTVRPAIAICFEGSPADDNFAEGWAMQTALRRGPMLRHIDSGMVTNPRFLRYVLDLAQDLGIPVQEAVRSGGRTNGAQIHLTDRGIPTIVIGIPVRYIHTHHGYSVRQDLDHSIALGLEVIRRLTPEIIAGF